MPKPELHCALEVREGVVRISLRGALRASGAAALAEFSRACADIDPSHPAVADLSGLEVADALGVEALREVLSHFTRASAVVPPPWTQACAAVHAYLAGIHLFERLPDLAMVYVAERRHHLRIVPRFTAMLDLEGGHLLHATTEDVSQGGARFSEVRDGVPLDGADLDALIGDPIRVTIARLGVRNTLARVVRTCQRPLGMGVAFRRQRPGALRRIENPET